MAKTQVANSLKTRRQALKRIATASAAVTAAAFFMLTSLPEARASNYSPCAAA
jgi:hypothetical protein